MPIQRQMVGELRHDNVGDQPLGRQPALDQPHRRRSLDDAGNLVRPVFSQAGRQLRPRVTTTVSLAGTCRDAATVLADHVQRVVTARADLLSGSIITSSCGRWSSLSLRLARRFFVRSLFSADGLLGLRLGLGVLGLQRLQCERQLVVVDALGAAAIHGATHFSDDVLELVGVDGELVALGGDLVVLHEQSGMGLARREDRCRAKLTSSGQR